MRIVLGVLSSLWFGSAHAAFYNGNEMHQACRGRDRSEVIIYVSGALDKARGSYLFAQYTRSSLISEESNASRKSAIITAFQPLLHSIKPYCAPKGVTNNQAADVFCKYLAENPAKRHEGGALLVDAALGAAWPCKPGQED